MASYKHHYGVTMQRSGIYKIEFPDNNIYIGMSNNCTNRLYQHKYAMRLNKHPNKNVQEMFNKYGIDATITEILILESDLNKLPALESRYIQDYLSRGYNVLNINGLTAIEYADDTSDTVSITDNTVTLTLDQLRAMIIESYKQGLADQ